MEIEIKATGFKLTLDASTTDIQDVINALEGLLRPEPVAPSEQRSESQSAFQMAVDKNDWKPKEYYEGMQAFADEQDGRKRANPYAELSGKFLDWRQGYRAQELFARSKPKRPTA